MRIEVAGRAVEAATGGAPFDPSRPAVVLLHGAGMDHTVWSLQARWFARQGYALLAPDLPGHGRSEGPPAADAAALAGWVAGLLDALGAGTARLAGHSMGALAALEFARRAPERAERLALLGAAPAMPVHPDLLRAAAETPPDAAALIALWGHGPAARLGGARMPGVWNPGAARALLARAPAGALAAALGLCAAYEDGLEAAAGVRCPTVVVSGAEDRMTPAREGRRLADAIPGARHEEIAGCGHMLMAEAPDRTLAVLADALGGGT